MRFQHKLLLVALTILIMTLVLSSILSLASFEKIYTSSLISTYEVSGKNLQRKIHAALRFGKPLTQFEGMGDLLDEMTDADPDIQRIDVSGLDQSLLYTTTAEERGAANPYAKIFPSFADSDENAVETRLIKGRYVTFLPLRDRSRTLVGYLNLEFPRDVVYRRLLTMAWENLKLLNPILIGTTLVLILLISWLITRPIQRRLGRMIRSTRRSAQECDDRRSEARNEFDELQRAICLVMERAQSQEDEDTQLGNDLTSLLAALDRSVNELSEVPDIKEEVQAMRQDLAELKRLLSDLRPDTVSP